MNTFGVYAQGHKQGKFGIKMFMIDELVLDVLV